MKTLIDLFYGLGIFIVIYGLATNNLQVEVMGLMTMISATWHKK